MDMCKKAIVPRLEELAFQVSYKEVIGNLILCPENRPESKRLDWATFSSFLTTIPTLTFSNIRDLVRGRLDQHLVGIVSDTVRYVHLFITWKYNFIFYEFSVLTGKDLSSSFMKMSVRNREESRSQMFGFFSTVFWMRASRSCKLTLHSQVPSQLAM